MPTRAWLRWVEVAAVAVTCLHLVGVAVIGAIGGLWWLTLSQSGVLVVFLLCAYEAKVWRS
jgi:hypothetical protein